MTEPPQGCRVAVIRLRSLGDCVLTTPALEILRRARPDLHIGLVVEDRFRPLFEGNPDVDTLLQPSRRALRAWRTDFCLNLHGGNTSAQLTALSGARWRAGFAHYRWQSIYNIHIPRAQEILGEERVVHTAEHLASAMFYLGVPSCEIPRAKLFAQPPASGKPYAVIHPLASAPEKSWGAGRFLNVARFLQETLDLEPVFIGESGPDLMPFETYRTVAGAPLHTVKTLLCGASLFLGNDSGPAHMAAALGIPLVVIFGASDPAVWHPWRATSAVIRHPEGIQSVTEAQVIAALERTRVHA